MRIFVNYNFIFHNLILKLIFYRMKKITKINQLVTVLTVLVFLIMSNISFAQQVLLNDDCSSNVGSWTFTRFTGTVWPNGMANVTGFKYGGSGNACATTYMSVNSYNGTSYTCNYNVNMASDAYASRAISTAGWENIIITYDWAGLLETTYDYGNVGYSTDGVNFTYDANKSATSAWTTNVAYNINAVTAANNNASFKIGVKFHNDGSLGAETFNVDNIRVTGTPITPAPSFSTTLNCGNTVYAASTTTAPSGQTWYWQGTNSAGTDVTYPTTSTYTALSSGTYYVRARATASPNSWSVNSFPVTVTVKSVPGAVSVTGGGTQCGGTLSLSATGGSGGIIYYQGTTSGGTSTVLGGTPQTVSSSGTYYFRAQSTDGYGCWGTQGSTGVVINPIPTASVASYTNISCYGGTNGTITVGASGGSGAGYTYSLNSSSYTGTALYSNLSAINYSPITVKDGNGCASTNSVGQTISQPSAAVTASYSKVDVSCYAGSNGSITVSSPSGGWGTYQAWITGGTWTTFTTSTTFSSLAPANYVVKVRDAANITCETTLNPSYAITAPTQLSATTTPTNPLCNGGTSGVIRVSAPSGGYGTYQASRDGTNWFTFSTGTPYDFTGLSGGVAYTITIRDAANTSCTRALTPITLTAPAAITVTIPSSISPACFNGATGSIQIHATGGTSPYTYSKNAGVNYSSGTDPYTFSNLSYGNYGIYVQDANLCTKNYGTVTLTNPPDITISSVVPTDVTCFGGSDGTIEVTATGGTGALKFSSDGTNFTSGTSPYTITGLIAGNYTIKVKDNNSCISTYASNPVAVGELTQLYATFGSTNITPCYGSTNGTITFKNEDGGSLEYNYSIDNGATWSASPAFTGLAAGTYYPAIQDLNYTSCTRSFGSITLTQPAQSNGGTITGGTTPICYTWGTGSLVVGSYTGSIVRWEKKLGVGGTWAPIAWTSATYSEIPSSVGTWYYRVLVQNGTGCSIANSTERAIVVNEVVTANAGINQNITGSWEATLAGNAPSFGTGTWTKQSGSGNASFDPNTNTYNSKAVVDAYDTYTYRWSVVNGACSAFDEVDITYGAATTTTFSNTGNWNDYTKWSFGVPIVSTNAIIDGDATVTANASCNKLTINAGKSLIINAGKTLDVNDSLILKSSTAGNAALIDKGTVTYNAAKTLIQLYVRGNSTRDTMYHYFSSPVNSSTINVFRYFFIYRYNEPTNSWAYNITDDLMDNALGYAGFYTGVISSNPHITVKFGGAFNTGNQTTTLSHTNYSGVPEADNFNLVGNPYPSPVDLRLLTLHNVEPTVYFWNGTDVVSTHNIGQYASYNINTGAYTNGGQNVLPSCQGLYVQSNNASSSIGFTNAARIPSSQPFLKTTTALSNHLRLTVDGIDFSDDAVIGFMGGATAEFDGEFDAFKLTSGYDLIPSLYTLSNEGSKLAVNENSLLEQGQSVVVPVEFTLGVNGTFNITASDINTFDSDINLFLEDLTTQEMINLRNINTYNFNFVAGDISHRFNLHFKREANTTGIDELSLNIDVYSYNNTIYVNSDNIVDANVFVYNVLGQEVSKVKVEGKSIYRINANGLSKGYYLVKVISDNKSTTKKVYID